MKQYEVIIIGGSYSGLSAAMALGRSHRKTLVIDNGKPCNQQTPYSHNFITHDGLEPAIIAQKAKKDLIKYKTIEFLEDLAIGAEKSEIGFTITTTNKGVFSCKKLVFATGVKDEMPSIPGFANAWGKSVIHCPYCHGYEVSGEETGILANGEIAFHYAQLISNWTKKLSVFTNGTCTMTDEQKSLLAKHQIEIIEKEIQSIEEENGAVKAILFSDNSRYALTAIYSRPNFKQHCDLPEKLGCKLTEAGLIEVDFMQKTTVEGVFACGDNESQMRSVANAVAKGNFAGAVVNSMLIQETFH